MAKNFNELRDKMKNAMSKIPTCVHFLTPYDLAYRSNQIPCGRPVKEGFLCDEHKRDEEVSRNARTTIRIIDQDPYIVAGILKTERETIAAGRITRVRFGSLEPAYVTYWE